VPFWLTLSEVVKVIWWIVLCQELLSIPAYKLQHFCHCQPPMTSIEQHTNWTCFSSSKINPEESVW
jgi:hypothetical protein